MSAVASDLPPTARCAASPTGAVATRPDPGRSESRLDGQGRPPRRRARTFVGGRVGAVPQSSYARQRRLRCRRACLRLLRGRVTEYEPHALAPGVRRCRVGAAERRRGPCAGLRRPVRSARIRGRGACRRRPRSLRPPSRDRGVLRAAGRACLVTTRHDPRSSGRSEDGTPWGGRCAGRSGGAADLRHTYGIGSSTDVERCWHRAILAPVHRFPELLIQRQSLR